MPKSATGFSDPLKNLWDYQIPEKLLREGDPDPEI